MDAASAKNGTATTNPILVTGIYRSGSTWVGKMLALAQDTCYIGEIFNPESGYLTQAQLKTWFRYVAADEGEHSDLYAPVADILAYRFQWPHRTGVRRYLPSSLAYYRLTRRWNGRPRPIVKDPISVLASEWMARQFDMRVVCLIRHPAAFAYSLIKAKWDFGFKPFLEQPALLENHLYEICDALRRPPNNFIERAALLWLCIYTVVGDYLRRNPDWMSCRLEDLSCDPVCSYEDIYRYCGLTYTDRIRQEIIEFSKAENPAEAPAGEAHLIKRNSQAAQEVWRSKLSPDDAVRIRKIVEPVAGCYYTDEDWG